MPATQTATVSPIGRKTPRVDGPLKVSGMAQYAADFHFPGMLCAVPVEATIAHGRVVRLDTAAAEKMPGIRAIFHRENIGKIFRSTFGPGFDGIIDERRPPFEDDVVRYYGQYVALAVADTFEAAKAAADAVRVTYARDKHNVDTDLKADDEPDEVETTFGSVKRVQSERGDPEGAFANAPVKLDQTYVTPTETHNPIELQATIAIWDGAKLTIYEESQGVFNLQGILAQMFGLQRENVRVITKFVGSGFGSKLWPWTHCPLAVAAARQLGKPVKLVISRKMMFQSVGHRPRTQQRVRLGATTDGKLVSLQHDYVNHHAILDNYLEDCGEATPFHYSVPNLRVEFGRARRNVGSPTAMRGPGAVPGLYGTESAMNELADQLKMDPVRLRVLNEPKIDESLGIPFSSRHFLECLELGAEKFGWSKRTPEVGSMKRDGLFLGWGMAGCAWIAAVSRRSQHRASRRWHRSRRVWNTGHRHRHVHDPRAACLGKDRCAARQGRSGAWRYVTSGGPDFGRFDGDWVGYTSRLCRGRQRDRIARDDRNDNGRNAVRKTQARRVRFRERSDLCEG
jgi:xanthine dehydrogenase YagR molybdenum-binding subunit